MLELGQICLIAILSVVICIVVLSIISKVEKRQIEKIKREMSTEDIEKIGNPEFQIYDENNNFLIGTSYIYEIKEDKNRYEIKLIFGYDSFFKPIKEFVTNTIYMDKETFKEKNLQAGQIVKTLHNRSGYAPYGIKQIL